MTFIEFRKFYIFYSKLIEYFYLEMVLDFVKVFCLY